MTPHIRSLAPADVERAAEVVAAKDEAIVPLLRDDLSRWLAAERGGGGGGEHYYVAEVEGRVVAIQGYQADPWGVADVRWLVWAYVDPEWRRRGLSSALLRHIEAALHEAGIRKLYLDVGNEAEHAEALAFHRSQGFRQEGYLPDHWRDGEDFLIFAKRLRPARTSAASAR